MRYLLIILLIGCQSNDIIIEKPPEMQETIKEIETLNIDETKKARILEKVKVSNEYNLKSFNQLKELNDRVTKLESTILDLQIKLQEKDEKIKELESELNTYRLLKVLIISIALISLVGFIGFNALKMYMRLKPI